MMETTKAGSLTSFYFYSSLALIAILSLYPINSYATRSSTFRHRADRYCAEFTATNHLPATQCVSISRNGGVCPSGFNAVQSFGGPVRGWQSCVATNNAAQARCAKYLEGNPELQCRVVSSRVRCEPGFKHDKSYGSDQTCIPGYQHSAELYCADYTHLHPGEQCRVIHRGRLCPEGFIHGHKYGRIGRGYKACIPGSKGTLVKQGIKKAGNAMLKVTPPIVPPFVPTMDPGSLVSYYKTYFLRVSKHSNGTIRLPASLIERYQREFKNNLRDVRVSESSAVSGSNAMTDCNTIYFPAGSGMKETVAAMTFGPLPPASLALGPELPPPDRGPGIWFFHELTHTEQCKEVGGRNNYAIKWFSHLSASLIKSIVKGENLNAENIHDNFPMEVQADVKGKRLMKIYRHEHPEHP